MSETFEGQNPTVIMIDDEQGDLDVMEAVLSDDYQCVPCKSGQEAIEAAEKHPDAIVLCDQRMPGLTGDEVLMRLRVLYPDTIRILITAYADIDALMRAVNEGHIFAYMRKPFTPVALKKVVDRAASFRLLNLQNRRLGEEVRRLRAQLDRFVERGKVLLEGDMSEIQRLAVTDHLTGLYNRRFLEVRVEEEEARMMRYGGTAATIMLDIDDFKKVNDTYGHHIGDSVLKQVAGALKRWCRSVDFVARYGGEEFLVVAPNTSENGAKTLAERLRMNIARMVMEVRERERIGITVSAGVAACCREDGISLWECVRRADEAMYRAKRLGKNRVVTWSELKDLMLRKPQSVFASRPDDGEEQGE